MKIKNISLSQKKGGNGYTSSFSLSIGKNEAIACGLIKEDKPTILCKIIDDVNNQIIIKPKNISISKATVDKVIRLADKVYLESTQSDKDSYSMREMLERFAAFQKGEVQEPPMQYALREFLHGLSVEELSDLATLMNIGRNYDTNINLCGDDRFIDYWAYISSYIPDNPNDLVDYLVEKLPLAKYLRNGVIFCKLPVGMDPMHMTDEDMEAYT